MQAGQFACPLQHGREVNCSRGFVRFPKTRQDPRSAWTPEATPKGRSRGKPQKEIVIRWLPRRLLLRVEARFEPESHAARRRRTRMITPSNRQEATRYTVATTERPAHRPASLQRIPLRPHPVHPVVRPTSPVRMNVPLEQLPTKRTPDDQHGGLRLARQ